MATPKFIARYEILNRIGRGGMGSLYLARDPSINRLVAIKLVNAELQDDDRRERFAQEAHSAGALNHPNIVTIFDYGVVDSAPYIVMEYIRGETLADVVKRRAPLSLAQKLGLLEQLCRGLAYAHEAGIVHRDIKPANLMLDQNNVLKILDFGIARLVDSGLTRKTGSIGTPGYMSPEQIEGHHPDRRSDLFAVGAVAYELLGYQPAFGGDTPAAIILDVLRSTPIPICSLAPDVGPDVAAIIDRALEKSPATRYQSAASLQHDLQLAQQAATSGGGVRAPAMPMLAPTSRPVPVPSEAPTESDRSGSSTLTLDPKNAGALSLRADANADAGRPDRSPRNPAGWAPESEEPATARPHARTRIWALVASGAVVVAIGATFAGKMVNGLLNGVTSNPGARTAGGGGPTTESPVALPGSGTVPPAGARMNVLLGLQDPALGRVENLEHQTSGLRVTVTYDLVSDDPTDSNTVFNVMLAVSKDSRPVEVKHASLSGDVGPNVTLGKRKALTWNAGQDVDFPEFDRFRFDVVAVSGRAVPKRIVLLPNHSMVLSFPDDLELYSFSAPGVANGMATGRRELLLNGRTPGSISLIIWHGGRITVFEVLVDAGG